MARDVTTLNIWTRATGRRQPRHLLMQVGVQRGGDLPAPRLGVNGGTSPLPRRVPLTGPRAVAP
jgi:hypothetical protein